MSSRLLRRCGEALYGPLWQSELSRQLGVSVRTMQRWADGTSDVPRGVYTDLLRLLTERAAEVDELLGILPTAAAPA